MISAVFTRTSFKDFPLATVPLGVTATHELGRWNRQAALPAHSRTPLSRSGFPSPLSSAAPRFLPYIIAIMLSDGNNVTRVLPLHFFWQDVKKPLVETGFSNA
jgi:hypothetical protein